MANNGRNLKLQRSNDGGTTYVTVAGIRTKSFTVGNEFVDVTTDDSNGYRTLLAEPGSRTIDVSGSGVTEDNTLRGLVLAATDSVVLEDMQLLFPNGDTLEMSMAINSYAETGEMDGAQTFEISLQSSGIWTLTEAP